MSAPGFIIHTAHSFLGVSPDGAVYDPSNQTQPFGFIEVKCRTLSETFHQLKHVLPQAFAVPLTQLRLNENHQYYAQVQGQMALGERPWCDFTVKGISVQCIPFNTNFWTDKLLPKLDSFYDNCIAPEIVSPVHSLGLPIRNLCV